MLLERVLVIFNVIIIEGVSGGTLVLPRQLLGFGKLGIIVSPYFLMFVLLCSGVIGVKEQEI